MGSRVLFSDGVECDGRSDIEVLEEQDKMEQAHDNDFRIES